MSTQAHPSLNLRAGLVSLLILAVLLGIWYAATLPSGGAGSAGGATAGMTPEQIEYAKLMGKDVGAASASGSGKSSGFPTLGQVASTFAQQLANPFYDNGPNDRASPSSSRTRLAAWAWASCSPAWWRCRWVS